MPLKSVGLASASPKRSTLPLCRLSRIGPMNFVFIAAEKVAVSAIAENLRMYVDRNELLIYEEVLRAVACSVLVLVASSGLPRRVLSPVRQAHYNTKRPRCGGAVITARF